jgi:hypothetical protein
LRGKGGVTENKTQSGQGTHLHTDNYDCKMCSCSNIVLFQVVGEENAPFYSPPAHPYSRCEGATDDLENTRKENISLQLRKRE